MSHPSIILYALSTCIHCRHTREFLEQNQIDFDCIYVDELKGEARQDVLEKVREVNPRMSFPTMIIGPQQAIVVGFNAEAIKEALSA